MATGSIRSCAVIHITNFDRSTNLKQWVNSWVFQTPIYPSPEQWCVEAQDIRLQPGTPPRKINWKRGVCIWAPLPAIANVAIELIKQARHRLHASIHLIMISKLFYQRWRRQLFKAACLMFLMPANFPFCQHSMNEPLILSFCFPYCRHAPWWLNTPQNCVKWHGRCRRCGKRLVWMDGLTCTNFCCCWKLVNFPSRLGMWCSLCYTSDQTKKFHVRTKSMDEELECRFAQA